MGTGGFEPPSSAILLLMANTNSFCLPIALPLSYVPECPYEEGQYCNLKLDIYSWGFSPRPILFGLIFVNYLMILFLSSYSYISVSISQRTSLVKRKRLDSNQRLTPTCGTSVSLWPLSYSSGFKNSAGFTTDRVNESINRFIQIS